MTIDEILAFSREIAERSENRHTLKDFMKHYNPETIQLLYGGHIVNIATYCKGSAALVRTFSNEKYYFVSYKNNNLILDYIGDYVRF